MKRPNVFQFSLLALIALTTSLCVLFAFAAADRQRYLDDWREERELVAKVERMGGSCTAMTCEPEWCRLIPRTVRPRAPKCVVSITLPTDTSDPTYPDTAINVLRQFKHLQWVTLRGSCKLRPGFYYIEADELSSQLPNSAVCCIFS